MSPRLFLASASPRRRDLLTAAGFRFELVPPATREAVSTAFTIRELTLLNALRKARQVVARSGDVVLAADTLVALDGDIIGKPLNLADARRILRRLSGKTHQVCTAVCVTQGRRARIFIATSDVRFRPLSDRAIEAYLAKIDPLDKAGAYAAQENDREIIARITGSDSNVVGLPMEETKRALREFGVVPGTPARESRRLRIPPASASAGGRVSRRGKGTRR
ncbi:MAG: Maf family protein [Chthoniobacterales bacterium]